MNKHTQYPNSHTHAHTHTHTHTHARTHTHTHTQQVRTKDSIIYVSFCNQSNDYPPYRIINHCALDSFRFCQERTGEWQTIRSYAGMYVCMYVCVCACVCVWACVCLC